MRAALRRGALAAALAALLGGCVVDVDGAPCTFPGPSADCPSGQACGNDHHCSARAQACVSSGAWCLPGACPDPTGLTTVEQAKRCVGDDPVCGTWIFEPCTAVGLSCEVRPGFGWSCVCPQRPTDARDLAVRPDGTAVDKPPFPTGAATPPACAFLRLGDGLAAAAGIAAGIAADPTAVVTVTAAGTFSAARGETFPLDIPNRVTVQADPAFPAAPEIVFDVENLPTALVAPVAIHSGGALAGFTVRNVTGNASHDALELRCDGSTPPPARLDSVTLDGDARLRHGVVAGSTCGLEARDVTVKDMSDAALIIDSAAGLPTIAFTGGSITGCGDGIVVKNGRLLLDGARIAGNAGMGVKGDAPTGTRRVEIRRSVIESNADTGVAIVAAPEIRITATKIFGNGHGIARVWPPDGEPSDPSRRAGGLVLWGDPPATGSFEFRGNRIHANGGDQILVMGTYLTWTLDGGGCGVDTDGTPLFNAVGCYDPTPLGTTASYRGVVAIDAGVVTKNVAWQRLTPSASNDGGDYASFTSSAYATFGNATVTPQLPYCAQVLPVCP